MKVSPRSEQIDSDRGNFYITMMVSKERFLFKSRFFCVRSHKSSASCGELLSPFPKLGTVDGRASKRLQLRHRLLLQLQRRQESTRPLSPEELCFFSFPFPPKRGNVEDGGFEKDRTCAWRTWPELLLRLSDGRWAGGEERTQVKDVNVSLTRARARTHSHKMIINSSHIYRIVHVTLWCGL